MITDMNSNKKFNKIRGRKLNISSVFITQSYFAVPIDVFFIFIMNISNKSFNKSHLVINQILTLKTLSIFTKNVLQNHILFSG